MTTALFTYSPFYNFHSEFLKSVKIVNQVDLTPTLSSILGIPIPFSNVGSLILECIPATLLNSVSNITLIVWRNVEQITKYVKEYSSKNSQFKSTKRLDMILHSYTHLQQILLNINNNNISHFISEYEMYMNKVLHMCQEVWAQFDNIAISTGLFFMCLSLVLCYCIISRLTLYNFEKYISKRFFTVLRLNTCLAPVFLFLCSSLFLTNFEIISYIIVEISSTLLMIWLYKQLISDMIFNLNFNQFTPHLFIFIQCIFSFLGLFTNSFILEEPFVIIFLFLSSLWLIVIFRHEYRKCSNVNHILKNTKDYFRSVIIVSFGIRIALNFIKCREEQIRCKNTIDAKYETLICIFAIVLIVLCINSWQKVFRVDFTISSFLPNLCLTLISSYWICQTFLKNYLYIDKIPLMLLATCFCSFCYLFYNPNIINTIVLRSRKQKFLKISRKNGSKKK